jgi:hypothetical protein
MKPITGMTKRNWEALMRKYKVATGYFGGEAVIGT